jgi:YfiH family protein
MPATTRPRAARKRAAIRAKSSDSAWAIRHADDLQILQSRSLARLSWLVHGFSTRPGGESSLKGDRVLNLGFTDWDARENVIRNRSKLIEAARARRMKLIGLRQIHSDVIHVIEAVPGGEVLRGDAAITHVPGLLLSVQTADCVPILLADPERRVVAAVHAGWRGTLQRITAKTVGRMQMIFGTRPADVIAALGPGIGRCCYEVGPEVVKEYASQFSLAREWFDEPFDRIATGDDPSPLPWLSMAPPGHELPGPSIHLDLLAANRAILLEAGVLPQHVSLSELCTACHTDLLFSYRREGGHTGRMMAVIGIR